MKKRHIGTQALNVSFLVRRMAQLGLKQEWVADQLGISRRTVIRWVHGQVLRVQEDHLAALANLLQCPVEELTLESEWNVKKEIQDRQSAAELINQRNLLELLTPKADYSLAESLIRATLHPGLPLPLMGHLHNQLALAAIRQFQLDRALEYAAKALEIGKRCHEPVLELDAQNQMAWAHFFKGALGKSSQIFERCHRSYSELGRLKETANSLFGLGSAQGYLGKLDHSVRSLSRSVRILRPLSQPLDLSMSAFVLGAALVGLKKVGEARLSFQESLDASIAFQFISGMGRARAGLALCDALSGKIEQAHGEFQKSMDLFAGQPFTHPIVYRYGAQIACMERKWDLAFDRLERALSFSENYRIERALVFSELALIARARGDTRGRIKNFEDEAEKIFRECGALDSGRGFRGINAHAVVVQIPENRD